MVLKTDMPSGSFFRTMSTFPRMRFTSTAYPSVIVSSLTSGT